MKMRERRRLLREHARYFLNNGIGAEARRRFVPALIRKALELEYIRWPKRLERHVRRRDILDVGCGMGLHGVGFVVSGVRSYTGCDPILKLDSDLVKNLRSGERVPCGWTPGRIMACLPQLRYLPCTVDALPGNEKWDVIVLHNTTEHLIDIARVFAFLSSRLQPAGRLIFNHHNFYAWNGHHLAPKNIGAIDPADARQRQVIDWAHLEPNVDLDDYLATRVNRIKLDELRALTERCYIVEEWHEQLSNQTEGSPRLTDEILMRYPTHTRRDLETQSVFCVARKRDTGASVAVNS